ncbi:beta-propeller domain-containing protein, partial [Blautia schinkii]|uniref:beta-propeller domain-containing protein n=1 Tax=Blautia schinkii TaxID=180164 RepID=UPI0023AF583D
GYFVTYRNTDPLLAADLSDPKNPRIMSELNITGFSEYLHFYGENQLLGIGWETDPDTGNVTGMKCYMFDISDPSDVRETDRFILKDVSFCDALYNYHAILASPKKSLFG